MSFQIATIILTCLSLGLALYALMLGGRLKTKDFINLELAKKVDGLQLQLNAIEEAERLKKEAERARLAKGMAPPPPPPHIALSEKLYEELLKQSGVVPEGHKPLSTFLDFPVHRVPWMEAGALVRHRNINDFYPRYFHELQVEDKPTSVGGPVDPKSAADKAYYDNYDKIDWSKK